MGRWRILIKAKPYSPQQGSRHVLERMLEGLRELRGVQRIRLFEKDGFVVYDSGANDAAATHVQSWRDLVEIAGPDRTITLVQERGYAFLRTVALGTLLVTAQRETNLGAARLAIEHVAEQMNSNSSTTDR